ncbi:hypothetical protein [Micromonospora sp. NPDC048839]|uniref:hypothetical protein n=1 Tax=Micromonospora sp. NPDC048839 TaxID=3155641 RepID=UPI0033EF222E
MREFLDQGGNYELAMRWTDREGRVWYTGIDPPPADDRTPMFDELEPNYTRIENSYQQSFMTRESFEGRRISGETPPSADYGDTGPGNGLRGDQP